MISLLIKAVLMVQLANATRNIYSPLYRTYDMVPQGICKSRRIPIFDNILTQSNPIQLSNAERGAIFWQSWNSSSFKKFADCKFYLQAPPRMGLYLTVTKAQLRKNSQGVCIDNIIVKKSNEKKFLFCEAEENNAPRVYSDDKGQMRITVNLDSNLPLPYVNSTLEVQFVVTVKRECDTEGFEPCEDDEDDSCIGKGFFNDGIVNCPKCTDEKSCSEDSEQVPIVNPSNVLLSAIISLLATMVVFGGCLWCVYRFRHCLITCNSNHGNVGRNNRDDTMVGVEQMQVELPSSPISDIRPTAPPADDKDFPPSYDSLFPTGSSER